MADPAPYDPLAIPEIPAAPPVDLTWHDDARDRDIPLRIYLPASNTPEPVVLFSHGLGGSRENNAFLGQQWAARGYVGVFLQHIGSDTSVWQGKSPAEVMGAMRQAANLTNFKLRVEDVSAVLTQLAKWNDQPDQPLYHRLNLSEIGMSGHSFGAVTTQGVSGETFPFVGMKFTDPRIKAACMFSPSAPPPAMDANRAFGSVVIPWMLMTGTDDVSPVGDQDPTSRLKVFPALPAGGKYQVVLLGAEHSAFGDRALPGDAQPRNPNHHRVMLALTTAFWDAYLKGDPAAKAWLDGDGAKSVLQAGDAWSIK